jgi:hypothetical protein
LGKKDRTGGTDVTGRVLSGKKRGENLIEKNGKGKKG